MKEQLQQRLAYITAHKQQFGTGAIAVIGVAVIIGLYLYNKPPVYDAANACQMFSPTKAMDAIGNEVIQTGNSAPIAAGDVAVSKCGYTDKNTDETKKVIATVAVQSAINDDGAAKNKQVFDSHKKALGDNVETVNNLGDAAYFEPTTGILNIATGKHWVKLLYGVGEGPTSKPLTEVIALARTIIR